MAEDGEVVEAGDEGDEPIPDAALAPGTTPVLSYNTTGLGEPSVVVARFSDQLEATMAAGSLEAAGVTCNLVGMPSNYVPSLTSITLEVPAGQLQRAIDVLSRTPARALVVQKDRLAEGLVRKWPLCPKCRSENVRPASRTMAVWAGWLLLAVVALAMRTEAIALFIALGLGWLAMCYTDRPRVCGECGHRFKLREAAESGDELEEAGQ